MQLGSEHYDPEFIAPSVHRERWEYQRALVLDSDPPPGLAVLAKIKYRKGEKLTPKTQTASKAVGRASAKLQPVARRFLAQRRRDRIRNAR